MHRNPAFSHANLIPAGARTLLVGAQTSQALANLQLCLAAAGATHEQLVQVKIYLAGDIDLRPGFAAWMAVWATEAIRQR